MCALSLGSGLGLLLMGVMGGGSMGFLLCAMLTLAKQADDR